MSKTTKTNTRMPLIAGIILTVLFILFIFVIKTIDVAAIGPEGSNVGLAGINKAVASVFHLNVIWYKLTQLLGYLAILIFAFFVICGFVQMIKRKSLFKVDRGILVMGCMFLVLFILYILFDKIAINYRPVILPGETGLEASFPSSHTMLAVCVFGSTMIEFRHRLKEGKAYNIIKWMMIALMVVTVVGHLLSGAHWFTDIIGGLLISGALISFFAAFGSE